MNTSRIYKLINLLCEGENSKTSDDNTNIAKPNISRRDYLATLKNVVFDISNKTFAIYNRNKLAADFSSMMSARLRISPKTIISDKETGTGKYVHDYEDEYGVKLVDFYSDELTKRFDSDESVRMILGNNKPNESGYMQFAKRNGCVGLSEFCFKEYKFNPFLDISNDKGNYSMAYDAYKNYAITFKISQNKDNGSYSEHKNTNFSPYKLLEEYVGNVINYGSKNTYAKKNPMDVIQDYLKNRGMLYNDIRKYKKLETKDNEICLDFYTYALSNGVKLKKGDKRVSHWVSEYQKYLVNRLHLVDKLYNVEGLSTECGITIEEYVSLMKKQAIEAYNDYCSQNVSLTYEKYITNLVEKYNSNVSDDYKLTYKKFSEHVASIKPGNKTYARYATEKYGIDNVVSDDDDEEYSNSMLDPYEKNYNNWFRSKDDWSFSDMIGKSSDELIQHRNDIENGDREAAKRYSDDFAQMSVLIPTSLNNMSCNNAILGEYFLKPYAGNYSNFVKLFNQQVASISKAIKLIGSLNKKTDTYTGVNNFEFRVGETVYLYIDKSLNVSMGESMPSGSILVASYTRYKMPQYAYNHLFSNSEYSSDSVLRMFNGLKGFLTSFIQGQYNFLSKFKNVSFNREIGSTVCTLNYQTKNDAIVGFAYTLNGTKLLISKQGNTIAANVIRDESGSLSLQ